MTHRIALIQMNSRSDFEKKLNFALDKIQYASNEGANLIAFPEMFLLFSDS